MKKLCRKGAQAACAAGMLCAGAAQAHDVWLLLPKYQLDPGDISHVYVGFGFLFPIDEFMVGEWVDRVELASSDGARTELRTVDHGYATPELEKPGSYVVRAVMDNWFYTTSGSGVHYASKEGLRDVIRCTYHFRDAAAIFNVGDGDGVFARPEGSPLQIVPLSDPAGLRVGDFMRVQVLRDGEPYNQWEASVTATYAGFSFEGADALRVGLDREGKASIRITHSGTWMIKASAAEPYPDSEVCDDRRYDTSLVFGIR